MGPCVRRTTCGWFDLPVGQNQSLQRKPVQSCVEKYFAFSETQIRCIDGVSRPEKRGVSRSSRTRGGMRWTRRHRTTNDAGCGRRSRVVLMPRRWHQARQAIDERQWQQSPVTGESAKETVKTIARETPE